MGGHGLSDGFAAWSAGLTWNAASTTRRSASSPPSPAQSPASSGAETVGGPVLASAPTTELRSQRNERFSPVGRIDRGGGLAKCTNAM